jgi:hypothetical protein
VVLRQLLAQAQPQGREDKGEAMTKDEALDLALEALERLDGWLALRYGSGLTPQEQQVVTAIKQALAQPATEEPVYHLRQFGDVTKEQLDRYMATGDINPQPAPVQEPAFYRHEDGHLMTPDRAKFLGLDLDDLQPLYTNPSAAPVPLTLGQKQRLWSSVGDKPTLKDRVNAYGLAIEAAHGITKGQP